MYSRQSKLHYSFFFLFATVLFIAEMVSMWVFFSSLSGQNKELCEYTNPTTATWTRQSKRKTLFLTTQPLPPPWKTLWFRSNSLVVPLYAIKSTTDCFTHLLRLGFICKFLCEQSTFSMSFIAIYFENTIYCEMFSDRP